jgi:heme-based aerotactic transducer
MSGYTDSFGQGKLNSRIDAESLLGECGIDSDEIEWRKEFINFDEQDVANLDGLQDVFLENRDQVADDFYDNLTQYDDTQATFERSSKSIDQLKETQRSYLATLADGKYDRQYFKNRARIGKLHDLLEMPMKQYIGQYGVYYDLLLPVIGDRLSDRIVEDLESHPAVEESDAGATDDEASPSETEESLEELVEQRVEEGIGEILSLLRILNLDMQVVADTYIHSYNQKLEDAIETQNRVIDQVEREVEDPMAELQEASNDIASSVERISSRTDDQVGFASQTSSEVANMSATVEEIASTASQVESRSQAAEDLAEEGEESAEEALDVMDDVGDAVEDVAGDVDNLQERVDEIDEIVEVIDDIAEQTNMLALNASIEAARAGEAGEGFAVVADEVKNLAEESQEYANRIDQTITDIQQDTEDTVESLDRTTRQVDRGVEQVEAAMDRLRDIVDAVKETSDGIQEVAAATDDQAASTEEVASMLDELVERAEDVAEEVEHVAAATEEQSAKIDEINESVQQLQAVQNEHDDTRR